MALKLEFVFGTGHVQACRALMIVSLVMGLASMVVSLLGLKCIKIGSAGDTTKAKMAVTGGILSMLAGEPHSKLSKPFFGSYFSLTFLRKSSTYVIVLVHENKKRFWV